MDAIKPLLKDFEGRTGIKVNLEAYGEDQLTQKLTTEFTAGGSDIDVFMQRPLQEARQYVQNKWYADLNPFVKDLAKTPADWNFRDFQSGAVGTELVKGQLTGIPIVVEHEVLYYRKDLLKAAGLSVPKTLGELMKAAQKLTDKDKGQFGFVARGQRSPAVTSSRVSSTASAATGSTKGPGRPPSARPRRSPPSGSMATSCGTTVPRVSSTCPGPRRWRCLPRGRRRSTPTPIRSLKTYSTPPSRRWPTRPEWRRFRPDPRGRTCTA